MEFELFSPFDTQTGWIERPNARWFYAPCFISITEADRAFSSLVSELHWQQEEIRLFGKSVLQPRLQAWHGDKPYTYSGLSLSPLPWNETLLTIKQQCETIAQCPFNSVLANRYRHGKDSMGWHQDNEKELGRNPVIASVTLGETRRFVLRHIESKEKYEFLLGHGSLLIMAGETQHYWQHAVPKTAKTKNERINLTFRNII